MVIGVDIGGTKCAVCKGDLTQGVVEKVKFSTTSCEETLTRIEKEIEAMGEFTSIGISCGGPLDSKGGVILSPPNLPGWDEVPITERFSEKFGVPVFLENDANACALAEWKFGAGKGTEHMIFLTFGTGMGAGLILNGKLYSGTNGMAGEMGHVRLAPFGPVGYGKQGSFEGFCSGGGLAQLGQIAAREQLQMGNRVSYCSSYEELECITAKKIADCAKEGHRDAVAIYEQCGEMLGKGLSILVDLLNPERIVIGSIYERCTKLLKPGMERVLKRECLSDNLKVCEIVPAMLGDEIGDYAALSVGMEE